MSGEAPTYIEFGGYSEHVPYNIPAAVQQATGRFLGNRAARIAEMPQWESCARRLQTYGCIPWRTWMLIWSN